MRKVYMVAISAALAACTSTGPVKYLFKPGSTMADKQVALDQCRISSLREIPQTMVSQTTGGYYNPGSVQCSTFGGVTNCQRVGAVNIPAETSTYDANAGLRARYIDQCLMSKGYSISVLPQCRTNEEKAAAEKSAASGAIPKCASPTLQ